MADQNKYNPPEGQPPSYPPAVHNDAPPYYQSQSSAPAGPGGYYGAPQDQAPYAQQGAYQQQSYYGVQQQQPYYGNAQPYYGNQPPMYYQQPAQGYFPDRGGRPGASEGFCAALLGLTACCCCMDFLF